MTPRRGAHPQLLRHLHRQEHRHAATRAADARHHAPRHAVARSAAARRDRRPITRPTGGAGLTLLAADDCTAATRGSAWSASASARSPATAGRARRWTFFEIDPGGARLLAATRQFTYPRRGARRDAPVVIGDARLKLAEAPAGQLRHARGRRFSSDAIPLHLLTDEAAAVYFRALAPDGLLLIHISNRFVDLEPVLAALARERGLAAAHASDDPTLTRGRGSMTGSASSHWVALSRDRAKLRRAHRRAAAGGRSARPAGGLARRFRLDPAAPDLEDVLLADA